MSSHNDSWAVSPYPGLRPFRGNEADVFFGRDVAVQRLLGRLSDRRFVAILGASGTGKSSLIWAGLMPALRVGRPAPEQIHGATWLTPAFRPGTAPIKTLAIALSYALSASKQTYDKDAVSSLETSLRNGSVSIGEWISQCGLPVDAKLLVIVDQLEELFLLPPPPDEISTFFEILLSGTRHASARIHVAVVLRSESLGECAEWPALVEAINDGQFLIPRLTAEELRSAIEQPLAVRGGGIDPRLVGRILENMTEKDDRLPLMQHALMPLWTMARERESAAAPQLRLEDYDRFGGGTRRALSVHADALLATLSGPERVLAEAMFRALSMHAGGDGDRVGRRPMRLAKIAEEIGCDLSQLVPVIDLFRADGNAFLVPALSVPLEDDTIIDISHESLIRQWDALRQWGRAEYRSAERYRNLSQQASRWAAGDEPPLSEIDLQLALAWLERQRPTAAWAARYGGELELVLSFVDASRKPRDSPTPRGTKIFMSYRRADTQQAAGRIFDVLKRAFSEEEVFFDVDTIPLGENFKRHIANYLDQAAVLVALIGERWPNPAWKMPALVARYFKPHEDHVQSEIEIALSSRIPILPILIDRAQMPTANQLPPSIAEFAMYNAAVVRSGRDFDKDMDRIVGEIAARREEALKGKRV